MADDVLVVGSSFDSSGLTRGLDVGAASLAEFEAMVKQVSKALPGLDTQALYKIAAQGAKQATVATQELNAALRATAGTPIITRDKLADLKLLASQLQQSQVVADQFTGSVNRMNMALLSRASGRIGDNGTSFNRGLANIGGTRVEESLKRSTRAANLMRSSLVTLAAQSVGTSSAIGGMAQSVLLFGGGAASVIAVAGAVLVAVKAFEILTTKEREARKAHDDLVTSFKQRVESETSALGGGASGRGAVRAEIQTLEVQREQLQIQQAIAASSGDLIGLLVARYRLQQNITAQQSLSLALALDEARAARASIEARQAPGRDLISGLGSELATLKLGEDAVRRLTVANQARTESERAAALAILNQILALERKKKAEEGAIESAKANTRFLKEQQGTYEDLSAAALKFSLDLSQKVTQGYEDARDAARKFAEATQAAVDALPDEAEEVAAHLRELRAAFLEVTDSIFGVVQAAANIGLIGEEAANAIGSVLDLADAINRIDLEGFTTGGTLGLISAGLGGLGVLGSMFGESAAAREHADILGRNTQALQDATFAYLQGVSGVTRGETLLAGLPPGVLESLRDVSDIGFLGAAETNVFNAELEKLGSSLAELDAIARQNGIQLLDSQGNIVAGALEALTRALELARKAAEDTAADQATRDAADAAEDAARAMAAAAEAAVALAEAQRLAVIAHGEYTRQLLDIRSRLQGVGDDPVQLFENVIASFAAGAPDFFAHFMERFGTGDFDSAGIQEQLRTQVLEWLDQVRLGQITAETLGLSEDQFKQFLEDAADLLGSFNQSLEEAAAAARDEARRLGDLRSRLEGDPQDAAAQFQRELELLAGSIPGLADLFAGLDLADPGTEAALRQQLLTLFDQLGDIDPALRDEFLALLGLGADVLDTFTDSVNEATKSLLNMPQGLNLAEFEWRARLAAPRLDDPTRLPFNPIPNRPGDGAALPVGEFTAAVQSVGDRTILTLEQILRAIQEGGGEARAIELVTQVLKQLGNSRGSPDQIARIVRDVFRRDAMATSGSPDGYTG